jgi:hypothetical protein
LLSTFRDRGQLILGCFGSPESPNASAIYWRPALEKQLETKLSST